MADPGTAAIRVLVVEDEQIAAGAHAAYVERTPGFVLAGVAHSGHDALRQLRRDPDIGLLLLDMHLPDGHGLDLLQRVRSEGHRCDVIAVTSARDLDVVRRAVTQGVVQYLLKPFTYTGFRAKLEQYAAYRSGPGAGAEEVAQHEVDEMLGRLRTSAPGETLPKGMSVETLRLVSACLRSAAGPMSASEVAEAVGASRVTTRRYLEHLADTGVATRRARYGTTGRPEIEYARS
ncbi:MAG: response regulator [Marmoricola sp.]